MKWSLIGNGKVTKKTLSQLRRCIFLSAFIPDKPFLDYLQMIDLLRSRNLIIHEHQFEFVIHSLKTYSYYDLINSNVENLLISKDSNTFKDNIEFTQLVKIKNIEDRLKSVFLAQILAIEKSFCSKLSYYIAEEFGVDSNDGGYLKKSNYSDSNKSIVSTTMKRLRDIRDSKLPHRKPSSSLKYYQRNHNHIPPWILVNELMFGEVINWYRCIKEEGKRKLSKELLLYEIDNEELRLSVCISTLDLLREFRNSLAHNSALSKIRSSRKLNNLEIHYVLNQEDLVSKTEFINENSQNLYACFISILLLSTDLDQLKIFLLTLEQIFNSVDSEEQNLVFHDTFGLPPKIFEISKLYLKNYVL